MLLVLSIYNYLQGSSYFSQQDIAKFFNELINGIEILHNLKILHRDIKVSSRGQKEYSLTPNFLER